ncbi:MAG TPA: hypothetical protein VEG68_08775 [Terriglobales bacterium]|nr:hypothetical protein [Terriglobales bacterium]
MILRDIRELVAAASAELEKTVAILAGSVLEGILYTFIKSQENYIAERRGVFVFDPNHSLQNYVSIFNKWFRDVLPNVVIPDIVVDYRDLVHINRELNSAPEVCTSASRDMLRIVDALLGELGQFAAPAIK